MPLRIARRTTLSRLGVLIFAVMNGACSHHHSSGPSDLAISDLQIAQNTTTHVLAFQATFVDLDGDLFNGTCNIFTNRGAVAIPINKVGPGFSPTSTSGPVTCVIQFKPGLTGTPLTGTMSVTDAGGHVSNALSFTTTIPERPRGTTTVNSGSVRADFARIGG